MKRQFSRRANHTASMVRNLATSLLLYERLQTTPTKARAAQGHAERLITIAKRYAATTDGGERLALYRRLLADTADKLAATKLVEVLAARFHARVGGYTRRIRVTNRLGDSADQVVVSLTELAAKPVKGDGADTKAAVVPEAGKPKVRKPAKRVATKEGEQ